MTEDEIDDSTAPLMEHLAELRNRLINSLIAFCVAMIAAFAVAGPIFDFLAAPIAGLLVEHGQKPELIFTGLQQGFMTQVRISIFGGFILAFPVIGYQLWRFVAPGLYKREKRAFLPFLLVVASVAIEVVALQEFARSFGTRVRTRDHLRLVLGALPYQWVLAAAAVRAVWREARHERGWEKTEHTNAHRDDRTTQGAAR